ncbi:hypothetical protein [Sphingobacterium sp. MYb388]|uniref:hypothetical protein n=1 Tax=Sphingobacterium sp. MYb388 TaxID=2745437 RepID=UPI0030AC514A
MSQPLSAISAMEEWKERILTNVAVPFPPFVFHLRWRWYANGKAKSLYESH